MKTDFFQYITKCISEEKLPHAFLIETNDIDKATKEIGQFLFNNQLIKNQQLENNINMMVIETEGKEIKSGQIEALQSRFATRPIYDKYNIYLIKNADLMNNSAANKLLKFLEEPTASIIGILILKFSNNLLKTVNSRCQNFKIDYSEENNSNDTAMEILNIGKIRNYEKKIDIKHHLLSFERSELIELLQRSLVCLNDLLDFTPERKDEYVANILTLDKSLHLLKSNVNIELVLDKLCIDMR